nr:DNA-3-methyladenine glycosylase [Achromobacter sp. UMC71]
MARSVSASAKSATANVSPDTVATRANQASRRAGNALPDAFFNRDARVLARELLGKVVRHRVGGLWLSARIIETEAYYLEEKGSHASLGYTHKRRALFMDGGVVYMYYARGGDSLNFSAAGPGNAVLIKSAYPWTDALSGPDALARMQQLNPDAQGQPRPPAKLCAGQTLLCRALGLKVPDWDARRFDPRALFVEDVGQAPQALISTTRLGIPPGRDEHLEYRYVDPAYAAYCTRNPLRRGQVAGRDYQWVDPQGRVLQHAP